MTGERRERPEGPGVAVGPGLGAGAGGPSGPVADPAAAPPDAAGESVTAPTAPDPPDEGGQLSEQQLEALLFVAERPLARRELATIAGVDRAVVDDRLGDLEVALAERGIRLLLDGDRVALATAPEAGPLIGRYVGADAVRLSPAALETLAIVAYRQPVTRAAIERIRGVDSDYTVRTLLHRRLVVELGRAETPGRPFLYGTGLDFLERFGLTSLEQLPPLPAEIAARLVEEGAGIPIATVDPTDEPDGTEGAAAQADDGDEADGPSVGPGTPVGPGPGDPGPE